MSADISGRTRRRPAVRMFDTAIDTDHRATTRRGIADLDDSRYHQIRLRKLPAARAGSKTLGPAPSGRWAILAVGTAMAGANAANRGGDSVLSCQMKKSGGGRGGRRGG